jgi:2-polyprenyl-6-methoxyphenol hydroxylase-like FAD-dependent oxidoreductase
VPEVLIVGAGLGGLCLAQGLRQAGIPVAVYERDPAPVARGQGYRVSLKQAGARALRACLPGNLFDLAVATSIRPATRMIFTDSQLTPKFAKPIPPIEPGEAGLGINRLTLREILLAGLNDIVHFGQTGTRYETTGERVRAHFADGTHADGDLLVGADGTGSAVRRQLIPGAVIDELGWAIYGRTPLTPRLLAATPDPLIDTFNRVIDADGTAIAIATCRQHTASSDATATHAPTVKLTDIGDYFSWTLTTPGPRPDNVTPEALHRIAVATTRTWHPGVREVLAHADITATFLVDITSARPVPAWDTPTVTLLGDAIHTMSPGRGDGATVALRDAHLLRDLLASTAPLAEAKRDYETQLLHYGFAAVEASRDHPFAPMR